MKTAVDVAVIGAGAAGLMTAIQAARASKDVSVLLLDTRAKIGAKILVSGGTRCNVTNVRVSPSDFHGGASHFVKHVLEAFTPAQTMRFFEEIGVDLVLEPTGKYFPTTHSGKTVLDALTREMLNAGAELKTGARVIKAEKKGALFLLSGEDGVLAEAKRVVLCTGGLSLPETGSDGHGYELARSFGHSVTQTAPALTPLESSDTDWHGLAGITLEVGLSFYSGGRKKAEAKGSFLFTHSGFSGPAALDISRHFALDGEGNKPEIRADFAPLQDTESLKKKFESAKGERLVRNFLSDEFGLPMRLAEIFVKKTGLAEKAVLREINAPQKRKIAGLLKEAPLSVTAVTGYRKAEVTAGGIDLKEVKVQSMESRLVPGLYFAGEILDVDGRIGGFNFQWAWSTGTLAGRAAAGSVR